MTLTTDCIPSSSPAKGDPSSSPPPHPPHPFAVLPRRVAASSSSKTGCPIDEIIQYQCQMHRDEVVCVPLVRLFRRCPGVPAVEITPEYDRLGRPIIPATRSPWIDPDATDVKHRSPMFHKVSQAEAQAREEEGSSGDTKAPKSWSGSRTSQDDMEELDYT